MSILVNLPKIISPKRSHKSGPALGSLELGTKNSVLVDT